MLTFRIIIAIPHRQDPSFVLTGTKTSHLIVDESSKAGRGVLGKIHSREDWTGLDLDRGCDCDNGRLQTRNCIQVFFPDGFVYLAASLDPQINAVSPDRPIPIILRRVFRLLHTLVITRDGHYISHKYKHDGRNRCETTAQTRQYQPNTKPLHLRQRHLLQQIAAHAQRRLRFPQPRLHLLHPRNRRRARLLALDPLRGLQRRQRHDAVQIADGGILRLGHGRGPFNGSCEYVERASEHGR